MKKTIFISIIMIFMLTCLAGCFGDKTSSNNTLSSDFSSIMQELSKNYEVKAVNGYSTDAIPNIDGYEFKVDGKSFKVLKMQDSDFNDFNPDNSDNEFLSNISIIKNNSKPYIAFIEKDGDSKVLDDFANISIE